MNKLKTAIQWRKNFYYQQWLKLQWKFKKMLDLSKKEKVDAISVVVVGRNDNYGGDFTERLRTTLDWNLSILPNPELIYIEWNQIPNKPSDCDWIVERYKNAKCYIVPKEIHDTITANPKMPVMEYFGKNVGIRKATNKWMLLINSDILIGLDVVNNMKKGLNKRYVYGTHYNNVKWHNKSIDTEWIRKKDIILNSFSANMILQSVVGNFVLTHKSNWIESTGYDETLNNVRAGVDENGKNNLLYLGIKPMVIGHHFHLDHKESMIHGRNGTHGFNLFQNIPYRNQENWGLESNNTKLIKNNIWQIEKI
ncbi:MAG: hypothetical protein DRJ01_14020 [Bacteroidetes bacterium]|nr:MAG: hypothetical protein DRJ01_14020 [Bacteroidota bacterium]